MKKFYITFFIFLFVISVIIFDEVSASMYKKTIAIDLDGVLNEYNGKYDEHKIPNIKAGAKDFIIELSKDYKLILFTTRNSKQAEEWLKENNVNQYFSEITNNKPLASIYIDDRALKFEDDYNKTLNDIKNYKVYWKN